MTHDNLIPDVIAPNPPTPKEEEPPVKLTDPRPEVKKFTPPVIQENPEDTAVETAKNSPAARRGAIEGDSPDDPTNVNPSQMGVAPTLDDTGGDPTEEIPGG